MNYNQLPTGKPFTAYPLRPAFSLPLIPSCTNGVNRYQALSYLELDTL